LVAIAVCAFVLTGCISSPRANVFIFQDGYGIYRCANGNGVVGEQADLTDNRRVPFGAQTEVRKDAYCANEEPALSPFWEDINASAELQYYDGAWTFCGSSPTVFSSSARTALSADDDWCGDHYYRVVSRHVAQPYYLITGTTVYAYTGSTYISR
jgi:hypothetical protein